MATYYFDAVNGNDTTGNGSIETPYKTITKLNLLLNGTISAGDIIYFKRGTTAVQQMFGSDTYVNLRNLSGSSGLPITFTYYGADTYPPVINAGVTVSDWAGPVEGVYNKASITSCNWFYEDYIPLIQATTSACSDGNWFWDNPTDTLYYKPTTGVATDHVAQREVWGGNFLGSGNNNYITIDGLKFVVDGIKLTPQVAGDRNNVIIQNCNFYGCNTSSQGGIFSRLILGRSLTDVTIQNNIFDYCRSTSIYLYTNSPNPDVHLRLTITGNNILHNNKLPDGTTWDSTGADHDGIGIQNMKDSTISYNDISGSMNYGATGWSAGITYWAYSSNAVAVTGAADNGSGLIRLTLASTPTNMSTGQRAVVYDVGGVAAANGIWTVTLIDSTHIDLDGSTFSGEYTSGGYTKTIMKLPDTGNKITRNFFHELGGGAGIRGACSEISNNIIAHYGGFAGISVAGSLEAGEGKIINNTIYDGDGTGYEGYSQGIRIANKTNSQETGSFTVKNNIVMSMAGNYVTLGSSDTSTIDNNCYYDVSSGDKFQIPTGAATWAEWQTAGYDADGMAADPLFANAVGSYALDSDFRLQSISPCVNTGADVGMTGDYDGNAVAGLPDIGAYEYQPTIALKIGNAGVRII